MQFALNFLRSNSMIDSPALLSSPFLLITLAAYGHKRRYQLDPNEAANLRRWVLLANAKGRYTRGSSETLLDQDLATVRQGGGSAELIDRLRAQVGRLDVLPEELEGRNQRSALFKTMFLAFRAAGAKDWRSNLVIGLDHSGAHHRLQYQHLFPKAVLKTSYTAREADDIANLSFISGKTNRGISDSPPTDYFPDVLKRAGAAAFDAQSIPTNPTLWSVDAYKTFLAARRIAVARSLNEFLGTVSGKDRESA
jgi:hypothetical protein